MDIEDNGFEIYPATHFFSNIDNEYLCKNTHLKEKYYYSIPEDYLLIQIIENNPEGNVLFFIETPLSGVYFKLYLLYPRNNETNTILLVSSQSALSIVKYINSLDIEQLFFTQDNLLNKCSVELKPNIVNMHTYYSQEYVYWTPKGELYHCSKKCPELLNSDFVLSGSPYDTNKRACEKCREIKNQ